MRQGDIWITDELIAERYVMPFIESNMYVIRGKKELMIIDPSVDEDLFKSIPNEPLERITVLLTHEHIDHISGVNRLRNLFTQTIVVCSSCCAEGIQDPAKNLAKYWDILFGDRNKQTKNEVREILEKDYICWSDKIFEDELEISFESHSLKLIWAPGHSQGGMLIFVDDAAVFTGDNLVEGNGVICRFPGGNKKAYMEKTYPKISELSDNILILPGHGKPGKLKDMRQFLRF